MLKNKKAVEINITTVIILVLAVLVLVILGMFFSNTMGDLWKKITKTSNAWDQTDVENSLNACKIRCGAQDKDYFCNHEFQVHTTGSTTTTPKKCWESPINAQNSAECKEVGYTESATCTSAA